MSEQKDQQPRTPEPTDAERKRALRDLDIKQDDAAQVRGGRMVRSSDPCEGGE